MHVPLRLQFFPTADGTEVFTSDPDGEVHEKITLPRPCSPKAPDELQAAGRDLFQALFRGGLGNALALARRQAANQDDGRVALQLRFDPDAVTEAQHPWELLHDGNQYLVFGDVDVTRYVSFPHPVVPVTVDPPLRVLVAAASPFDQERLDVDGAMRTLRGLPAGEVRAEDLASPTYTALLSRLSPHLERIHVFDFEGHGDVQDGVAGLYFETAERQSDFVSASALGAALSGTRIAFALINACHGADTPGTASLFNSIAPALILAGVPAVVGMQGEISDPGANAFAGALYQSLGRFVPVTVAVAAARRFLFPTQEWHKPVLYLRSTDDAGKILTGSRRVVAAQVNPADLLDVMRKGFGTADFAELCYRLGVRDYDLPGDVLAVKMMSLIDHESQRGSYSQLVDMVLARRPHLREALLQAG